MFYSAPRPCSLTIGEEGLGNNVKSSQSQHELGIDRGESRHRTFPLPKKKFKACVASGESGRIIHQTQLWFVAILSLSCQSWQDRIPDQSMMVEEFGNEAGDRDKSAWRMQGRSCFLVITGVSAGIPEKAQGTSGTAM